jgi:hypothetical protein
VGGEDDGIGEEEVEGESIRGCEDAPRKELAVSRRNNAV